MKAPIHLLSVSLDEGAIEALKQAIAEDLKAHITKLLKPVTQPKPLTVLEAAKLLGMHERTLRHHIAAGTIKIVPGMGKRGIRIAPAEIDRLLAGKTRKEEYAD